jgi:hypothetical protein
MKMTELTLFIFDSFISSELVWSTKAILCLFIGPVLLQGKFALFILDSSIRIDINCSS